MTPTTAPWLLRTDEPRPQPRVPSDVEYHRVFAGEHRRIGRGLLAIALLFVGLVGIARLFLMAAAAVDENLLGRTGFTPLQQAAGALALAALIPYSMLVQRLLYGVPGRSLHSVSARFRYGVFARSLLAFGPLVVVLISLMFLAPGDPVEWSTADLVGIFLTTVLLTPLQAAGEEYGVRGLMFRVVGGWTRHPRSGAALGIIVTTVLFSLLHGTLDPYLLSSYVLLFSVLAYVTWRTGGLEVAVVLHTVYNATALLLATTMHVDLGGALGTRAEASGSLMTLVPGAGLVVVAAVVGWMTRTSGPARTPRAERAERAERVATDGREADRRALMPEPSRG